MPPLIGHEHGGRPAHPEVGHRTQGALADSHRCGAQDAPRRRGRRHGECDAAGRRDRGDDPPARLEDQRCGRGEARFTATAAISAPAKPRPGIRKKPAPTEPAIDPTVFAAYTRALAGPAVSLPSARTRTANGKVAPMQSAGGKSVTAQAPTWAQIAAAAQLHRVGERGHPVYECERRER